MDCESDDQVAVYFDRKLQQQLGCIIIFYEFIIIFTTVNLFPIQEVYIVR